MPDQNQNLKNTIPGTLRTLKTDLDLEVATNPQDRLQQAGNFIQSRPTMEPSNNVNPNINVENKVVEKQDIPPAEIKLQQDYSWSNMKNSQSTVASKDLNLDLKKDTPSNATSENKSGFSVLEDTIDLPLDNLLKDNINTDLNTNSFSMVPNTTNLNSFGIDNPEVTKPKSSIKVIFPVFIVILLLTLIGGGVYIFNRSQINTNNITNEVSNPTNEPVSDTTTQTLVDKPLFSNISKTNVDFIDSEPIRRTILSTLNDKKDTLIEINLTKDANKIALEDVATAFGITIPFTNDINQYWFYAYNQEGIYKLTAVLQLKEDKKAKELVDNWGNSIPRDLSGFSINLPSRIVNTPTIKNNTITNNSGKSFDNNYYNYTSPADSIDVSSYENYILMASSQNSMRYILNQIP